MEILDYRKLENGGKVLGFLTIKTSEGFEMKNFKLVQGTNGLFVGAPSQKGKDEKRYDTVWIPKELNETLLELVSTHVDLSQDSNPVPF